VANSGSVFCFFSQSIFTSVSILCNIWVMILWNVYTNMFHECFKERGKVCLHVCIHSSTNLILINNKETHINNFFEACEILILPFLYFQTLAQETTKKNVKCILDISFSAHTLQHTIKPENVSHNTNKTENSQCSYIFQSLGTS
jgi:hypothetical protein